MKKLLAVSVLLAGAGVAMGQQYVLVDLGTFQGESSAFAVDANSMPVGTAVDFDHHYNAVRFPGVPDTLPGLPGFAEHAAFDRVGGVTYGASFTLGALDAGAFSYDGSTLIPLGAFSARAANASGTLAGTTNFRVNGFVFPRACRFQGGALATLPTLGGSTGQGLGIDAQGNVVGSASARDGSGQKPCLWIGSATRDLGTLGGATGQANAVRSGVIVGTSQRADGVRRPTRWVVDASGAVLTREDLGSLTPNGTGYALAMNSSGDIVGTCDYTAVRWRAGQAIDLNGAIAPNADWVLQKAWAINDAGVIVGVGARHGNPRAFELLPCSPIITTQPASAFVCPSGTAILSVGAALAGGGTLSFQWQKEAVPGGGLYADVVDGATNSAMIFGSRSSEMYLFPARSGHLGGVVAGNYRVVVTGGCGSITSDAAMLSTCPADQDDGAGGGLCDGGVDVNDLLYFLTQYAVGQPAVDLDDGSMTGNPDGGVDVNDLLYFLERYEAGC